MRIKFTVFLIILNLGLLGGLWWLNQKTTSDLVFRTEKLVDFEGPEIEKIEIAGSDSSLMRILELKDGAWRITSPIDWPANFYAVQRILTHLEFIEEGTHFPVEEMEKNGQTLADYGLDNPQVVLTFEGKGKRVSLSFGQVSPIDKKVYILSPDKKRIHLAQGALLESLLMDLEDMRSQDIFNIPQYEVKGLSVKVDPINLTMIVSREGDVWQLKAPIQTKASQRQVESILNELRSLRLVRFLKPEEKDSAQLGLAVPSMRVTLVGNNRRQTLKLGAMLESGTAEPQFIAQLEDSPSIFTVVAKPFIALRDSQDRFREKRFLEFEPESLTSIDISREGKTISLQRLESGTWQVLDPSDNGKLAVKYADEAVMLDLIQQLNELKAIRFASDAPSGDDLERFGFNQPQRVVKLFYNNQEQTLLVGGMNADSGLFYAKLKTEPFVYEVSSRILSLLQVNALHYQDRKIEAVPASAKILSLTLKDVLINKILFEGSTDDDLPWQDLLQTLPEERAEAINGILGVLKSFNVESFFISEFDEKAFSLDKETRVPWRYALEVEYDLPGSDNQEPKRKTYYFTKRLGGNLQVGRTPGLDNAFRLKQNLIDALFTFTFDHEASFQDEEGMASIETPFSTED